jgi:hypothetical protein
MQFMPILEHHLNYLLGKNTREYSLPIVENRDFEARKDEKNVGVQTEEGTPKQ